MQQPPNQEYPQNQWQQQNTSWGSTPQWQKYKPLPTQYPQQMPPQQQQTNYAQPQSYYPPPPTPPQQPPFSQQQYQKQQWYQPDYTQSPTYNSPQQLPIQRPKRNRIKLWISVSIAGVVLAILVVVSSVLIYSLFFSPSHSLETIFTSTQYPALHTEYNGTIAVSLTSSSSPLAVPMVLIITSNDNQGHISGRIGILLAPYGGDPFIGTLGVDGTITFTATPYPLGVLTIFTGRVNSDNSISGTTSSSTYYPSEPWKLFPVKGK